jgi:hypothetical protein
LPLKLSKSGNLTQQSVFEIIVAANFEVPSYLTAKLWPSLPALTLLLANGRLMSYTRCSNQMLYETIQSITPAYYKRNRHPHFALPLIATSAVNLSFPTYPRWTRISKHYMRLTAPQHVVLGLISDHAQLEQILYPATTHSSLHANTAPLHCRGVNGRCHPVRDIDSQPVKLAS